MVFERLFGKSQVMCRRIVFLISVMSLLTAADRSLGITWTNDYPGDDSWCTSGNWAGGAVPGPLDVAEMSTPPEGGPVIDCNVNVGGIEGPNPAWGSVQVMDVVAGTVVTDTWLWHSGIGTATINVNGSPHITIYGYGWRGPDDGTGILNISGDPNITVEGDLRGADASGQFVMNMSGGTLRCRRFKIGDNGGGEVNLSDGFIDVTENLDLGGLRGTKPITVKVTGGLLDVDGELMAPANPCRDGVVTIKLHGGSISCGSFTHAGAAYGLDVTEGIMTIDGDVRADIEADVAAGYVTAYGGKGTVAVDYNNINPGRTTISASPRIIYVDVDAAPGGDGASWASAFKYLQDGLAVAASGDEIWVAEGVYKPDEDTAHPDGSGVQNATFQLISGVAVYGSYAGFSEPDPNTRDLEAYETILSGDLNGDDSEVSDPVEMLYDLARSENSFYVVLGSGADESAFLDGFVITGGNGAEGGGMLNVTGSPTLKNCTFRFNMAWGGGGMCNRDGSQPTLIECTFSGNLASIGFGGAIGNYGSAPTLIDCIFEGNVAGSEGGAIHNGDSSPRLVNCVFSGNTAGADGGAVWNWLGRPMLVNCTFTGNSADRGGAIWNNNCSAVLSNCLFGGNTAVRYGGGLCRAGGTRSPTLANCTFSGNSAGKKGGGICNWDSGDKAVVQNCVLWGNTDESGMDESSQIDFGIVNYCCIQGWTGALGGVGNIGGDPLLFDAANHDWHLLPRSACIDVGDNSRVTADMTDLDGDGNTTEPIPWDLDGNSRIVDGDNDGNSVVDMGAYEANYVEVQMKFTPQAFNPNSQGKWFKLHFVLPEGFAVEDVDVSKPALCKLMDTGDVIESDDMSVFVNEEDLVEIKASFDRGALSLCGNGQAERNVTVLGILRGTGGQDFYGTDTIRIINRTWEHLAGLTLHWLEEGCGEPDWCGGQDINQDGAVDFVDLALFDGCCIEIFAE